MLNTLRLLDILSTQSKGLTMFEYRKFLKDQKGLTAVEYAFLISVSAMGLYLPLSIAFNEFSTAADVLVGALTIV